MVVKEDGICLRWLVGLGFATGVLRGPMGGGPTATLGTPVPGAAVLLLGVSLGGVRGNRFPRSICLGASLVARAAALSRGASIPILTRFLGLGAFASHVPFLAAVVAGDVRLIKTC